jgi:uncharacterized short protein YbdD (DUF466 family)
MERAAIRTPLRPAPSAGHRVFRTRLRSIARRIWRGLREWCGDAAYESYLRSQAAHSCSSGPLSPAEFYVEELNRRYSRPNRCC